jgi:hypothetical protein
VFLVETLDAHTDVVTGVGNRHVLVVLLNGENTTSARVAVRVGRDEDQLSVGLELALFDTTANNCTNTLDVVDGADRQTERLVNRAGRDDDEGIQGIVESVDVDGLLVLGVTLDILALPPAHVLGLLEEVITNPARDGEDGDASLYVGLGPADLLEHQSHLISNFLVTLLLVASGLLIHLVDANDELLDTQQVEQTSVHAGLALSLVELAVLLLSGNSETTISGDEQHGSISSGRAGNHVLDEILVAGSINDGVVLAGGEELLGGIVDGDTTETRLLLTIAVESEDERVLAEGLSFLTELGDLTLRDTTKGEQQVTDSGGFAGVDVAGHDDGDVLLLLLVRHGLVFEVL